MKAAGGSVTSAELTVYRANTMYSSGVEIKGVQRALLHCRIVCAVIQMQALTILAQQLGHDFIIDRFRLEQTWVEANWRVIFSPRMKACFGARVRGGWGPLGHLIELGVAFGIPDHREALMLWIEAKDAAVGRKVETIELNAGVARSAPLAQSQGMGVV